MLQGTADVVARYAWVAGNAAASFAGCVAERRPRTTNAAPHRAARLHDYLRAAGDFGALAARTIVTDAAARVAASAERIPDHDRSTEPRLDARHALTYMRDVLNELEAPVPSPLG